ncbi:efflux RND transporter periplasmic adaptor subunit [Sulfuricystis multivorans]|uniref:efflux RND transporter periplasmic adaptor subunit n=1 Tax=Sulfuricystis multivorans TaxID=2211108 RepID=UPI000F842240|nr:efflux RND transporter periplasmic adaptor subunit [Sulfuricystis multivorans]
MKKSLLTLIALIAVVAAGGWWFTRPKPISVRVHRVETGRVEATLANTRAGSIESCQRTKLSTIAGGRIEYLGVKEGDRVEAGQVLMRLWRDDLSARAQVAEAQLASAKSRANEACTVADNAEREASRQEALAAKGFVSSSRAESARTEAKARRTACSSAQKDIVTAERQVAAARADLSRTVITAPFAGTVAKIVGEVGEYSTPSPPGVPTPPAIDLIDDTCLYVKAPMDELDAPKIKTGQAVRIRLDAYPNRVFAGHVRRVAPFVTALEKQARTVDVEVDFDTPDEAKGLLVGYSADVEVLLEARDDVLRIPTAALQEGNRVLVIPADGRLKAQQVKPGLANWEWTEVREGLSAGSRIVLSLEKEGVKPGAYVVEESAAGGK